MRKGELLGKVITFATNAHDGQFDRGGKAYILHPLAVMYLLNSADEELNCIAVLHDVVEDTKTSWQDLRDIGCSNRIINALRALTKIPGQTYDEYKQSVLYNIDAMMVKKADLRHNSDIRRLKGITEKDIARTAKYHAFYLEIEQRLQTFNEKSS